MEAAPSYATSFYASTMLGANLRQLVSVWEQGVPESWSGAQYTQTNKKSFGHTDQLMHHVPVLRCLINAEPTGLLNQRELRLALIKFDIDHQVFGITRMRDRDWGDLRGEVADAVASKWKMMCRRLRNRAASMRTPGGAYASGHPFLSPPLLQAVVDKIRCPPVSFVRLPNNEATRLPRARSDRLAVFANTLRPGLRLDLAVEACTVEPSLRPDLVGVDMSNRSPEGINPAEVQLLDSDLEPGWSIPARPLRQTVFAGPLRECETVVDLTRVFARPLLDGGALVYPADTVPDAAQMQETIDEDLLGALAAALGVQE